MARVSIKMARVSIWNVRLPCQNATSWVDWVGMTMEWESGGPNLFHLSAKRCVRLRRPQGCDGALMRDLSELGKLRRADLVRLLGLGRHGHSTVYRWTTVCGADAASVADQGDTRL